MAALSWAKYMRPALISILVAFLLCLLLYGIHQLVLPLVAFILPGLTPTFFDFGVYGAYPTRGFVSFNLTVPIATLRRWNDRCDRGLVLLTPNGPSVARPGPMILDARGNLVWTSDAFGSTSNLKVQHYNGADYLTLWSGDKAATSGRGVYHMINSTYQVDYTTTAIGANLFGDLHEFKITPDNTALITVYNDTTADLSKMGMLGVLRGTKGGITDNLFQEINLETNELLFQWRASDHFNSVDTYYSDPFSGYSMNTPFDWYHINSVDKDSSGNYLISSRHFHHVVCVSPTGQTLWILGGKDNQFNDLSHGHATNFKWQHDARWLSEADGTLTIFNNGKAGDLHIDASQSRAMFVQLDIPNRTARLVRVLHSLQGILASSQGSVQILPDTQQVFVGWGSAAAYSEYSAEGDLICETHLGASWFYYFERMKSYRTNKVLSWHGEPSYPPKAIMKEDAIYVSWNGATDVTFWSLEGTRERHLDEISSIAKEGTEDDYYTMDRGSFEIMETIPKAGFEGSFDLKAVPSSNKPFRRYRVAALNANHDLIRFSDMIKHEESSRESSQWKAFLWIFGVSGGLAGLWILRKYRLSTRNRGSVLSPVWMEWHAPTTWRSSWTKPVAWIPLRWTGVNATR